VRHPSPTESVDSDDMKKDAILNLCVVVGLFVHVWCAQWCVVDVRVYEHTVVPDERLKNSNDTVRTSGRRWTH
jgi:hypothetical protein